MNQMFECVYERRPSNFSNQARTLPQITPTAARFTAESRVPAARASHPTNLLILPAWLFIMPASGVRTVRCRWKTELFRPSEAFWFSAPDKRTIMWPFMTKRRRKTLLATPFPSVWKRMLRRRYALYSRLSPADQRELEGHIHVFLAEKNLEGCGGLALTDEIKVTVAAQACLLLLHRQADYFPDLKSVLVYPTAFVRRAEEPISEGVVVEGEESLLGESWDYGVVVLAWDSVCEGAADPADGWNVVYHEFAHQLDQEDGLTNGFPSLVPTGSWKRRRNRYAAWHQTFTAEFEALRHRVRRRHPTLLDEYGSEDPAEFFAVATESFFEQPRQMKKTHPGLFQQLRLFYQQDPREWFPEPKSTT